MSACSRAAAGPTICHESTCVAVDNACFVSVEMTEKPIGHALMRCVGLINKPLKCKIPLSLLTPLEVGFLLCFEHLA